MSRRLRVPIHGPAPAPQARPLTASFGTGLSRFRGPLPAGILETFPGRAFAVTLAVVFALRPLPGAAQTVTERVRAFAETASGFSLRPSVEEGSLATGQDAGFPLDLEPGVDYMVVAFCDSGCVDLDLTVLDPAGEEVERDDLPDAQPVVLVTPVVRGRFEVRVEMVACSTAPCDFAVGILEGESGGLAAAMGESMHERMELFRSDLVLEGFTEIGMPEAGTLDEGQEIRFSLALTRGVDFEFVGVCDNDCEDMDLVLYDPAGEEVASDLLPDAIPILSVTPAATGEYRMAARMVTCTVEPCAFLVGIFVSGEGVGPGGVPLTGPVILDELHQGTLQEGDGQLTGGRFFDVYTVHVEAGQTIIADLRSPDFDTYLILETPGEDQEENDDWADDTMHSHVELVVPEAGTYSILVTSFMAGETGEYTLEIAVVGEG